MRVYKLRDWSGDDIDGTFYEPELQAVNVDVATEYRIEKVLRKRTHNKNQSTESTES